METESARIENASISLGFLAGPAMGLVTSLYASNMLENAGFQIYQPVDMALTVLGTAALTGFVAPVITTMASNAAMRGACRVYRNIFD